MPWALILDGLLAVLLLLMIAYAFVLNRRLATLRTDREDLEAFIARFNDATNKANGSLQGLRSAAEANAALIKDAADKAQALRDELAFLVERADGSAERLAKASARPDAGGASEAKGRNSDGASPTTVAGSARGGAARRPADRRAPSRGAEVPSAAQEPSGQDHEAASEAERELLNALRRAR